MPKVNLLFFDKSFFSIPPKKIKIEDDPGCDRTYFISGGRIIAVASRAEDR